MNNFIKQVIEEKFASKKQQRYFYAKASDESLPKKERKKWSKWAKEFSADTDFKKLPEKKKKVKKKEVDEIVDEFGNIKRGKKSTDFNSKGITQKKTSDEVVKTAAGSMGNHAFGSFVKGMLGTGPYILKYWGEGTEISKKELLEIALNKALGADETIMKDADYDEAKDHLEDDLGIPEDETEDRLAQMGYDEELPEDKVRLVENPKKFIEEFIESILAKKNSENEFVKKGEEKESKQKREISPIVKRQLFSLKDSLKSHGLTPEDVLEYLKDNE